MCLIERASPVIVVSHGGAMVADAIVLWVTWDKLYRQSRTFKFGKRSLSFVDILMWDGQYGHLKSVCVY